MLWHHILVPTDGPGGIFVPGVLKMLLDKDPYLLKAKFGCFGGFWAFRCLFGCVAPPDSTISDCYYLAVLTPGPGPKFCSGGSKIEELGFPTHRETFYFIPGTCRPAEFPIPRSRKIRRHPDWTPRPENWSSPVWELWEVLNLVRRPCIKSRKGTMR